MAILRALNVKCDEFDCTSRYAYEVLLDSGNKVGNFCRADAIKRLKDAEESEKAKHGTAAAPLKGVSAQ